MQPAVRVGIALGEVVIAHGTMTGAGDVVLPFDNLSADPEHGFVADGITEEIITELARLHDLRVFARTSAFGLEEQAMGVLGLHGELGISYVLEGSVRRGGSRVRISTKLVDARTGS